MHLMGTPKCQWDLPGTSHICHTVTGYQESIFAFLALLMLCKCCMSIASIAYYLAGICIDFTLCLDLTNYSLKRKCSFGFLNMTTKP